MAETSSSPAQKRILQLVTQDKLGGVRTLMDMVESGLRERGFAIDTLPLYSGQGGRLAIRDLARVAIAILSRRYDAIFSYQAAASVFGGFLGWVRGTPLRVVHQTASPEGIRPHWKMLDRLFGATGIYTHFISNSAATTAAFADWPAAYRQRFVLIPHGVDPIPAASGKLAWRERLGIPEGALVLVATGRMVGQKNHSTAVRALPGLPRAHLIIAGDGPDEQALKKLADTLGVSARLHLIGPIGRPVLGDVLAAGDIYLFPSVWETFGLAGVEAAMAGLPIVAADLPVLREVLDIGKPGTTMVRFHPPHDVDALIQAVEAFAMAYPGDAEREGFAAEHRRRHARERMLELYDGFLSRVMAR